MSDQQYVLTIATGKKLYLDLAVNLARSFLRWHDGGEIKFQLVTDLQQHVPRDIRSKIQIIEIKPGEFGLGFSTKLFLDHLSSPGQTLFIDSDCLIFGNLAKVFESFKGHKVSVIGNYITDGEWFGDVKEICSKFKIPHLPKFNGGIYYLEKGPVADKVYHIARDLERQYDRIGFVRLRNRPNDEVIMALAMQLEGLAPLIDDGSIMSDPQACPGRYQIDVRSGSTLLVNPPLPHPEHRPWYPFEKVTPLIVHFLGAYTLHYPYRREVYRLSHNLNWFGIFKSVIAIEYPERFKLFLKNTFRSAYHKFWGIRKIKSSERMVT
jgi:hypothetical protein